MGTLKNINQLLNEACGLTPKSIVIPGGDRPEDLEVYKSTASLTFVDKCILIGNREQIIASAKTVGVEVPDDCIVHTENQQQSAEKTVEIVKNKEADIILKGNISTPILNRQILKLKTQDTMSLCTLVQSPHIANGRPILITDPGVTTVCNYSRQTSIIKNAAEVARHVMGVKKPRLAILSANEKIIPSLPSTELAQSLSESDWEDMIVYGPLSFDLATSPESVLLKKIPQNPGEAISEVAGKADVLVCPGLDSANILYKVYMSLVETGQAQMAGITMGVKVPYVILSRADSEETKVNSIALCSIFSEKSQNLMPGGESKTKEVVNDYKILSINPGSTSTKLGLFNGEETIAEYEVIRKAKIGLRGVEFMSEVEDYINEIGIFLNLHSDIKLDAVVGRGGFINRDKKPLKGGAYSIAELIDGKIVINNDLIKSVSEIPDMDHPSNYGIPIAAEIAKMLQIPAFMVDAVVADDFEDIARISGYKGIERRSTSHFLSQKAMANKAAEIQGRPYYKAGYVCAHMGGDITIGAYRNGKIIDNTIALLGEGPFTPQRAGQLPLKELIELCYSGKFTKKELFTQFGKHGGLMSYLGTESVLEIIEMIEQGNEHAKLILDAMIYQISKSIGSMFVAVGRKVDAIVFAGGMVRSKYIMDNLKKYIGHLAPVISFKDTPEMEAMAKGALKVLKGIEEAKVYSL